MFYINLYVLKFFCSISFLSTHTTGEVSTPPDPGKPTQHKAQAARPSRAKAGSSGGKPGLKAFIAFTGWIDFSLNHDSTIFLYPPEEAQACIENQWHRVCATARSEHPGGLGIDECPRTRNNAL
jgi:hypothetical protein